MRYAVVKNQNAIKKFAYEYEKHKMLPVFNKTALTKSFAKKCRNLKIRYGRGNVRPGSVRRGRVSREFVRSGNCPIIHLTPIGKFILSSISNGLLF